MKTNAYRPSGAADPIVKRLRRLVKGSPDLKDGAQLYETILPILRDTDLSPAPVALTRDQARVKMEAGLPLLHDLDLELDIAAAGELMLRLARAAEKTAMKKQTHRWMMPWLGGSHKPGIAARRVRLALEEDRFAAAILPHIAAGESDAVTSATQGLELSPNLVRTLAQNALKPALRAWCRQLTPLAEGIEWHRGYCFICGAVPTLGELQENDQVKHLRCGSCGADWRSPRLQCMYCGNEDHNSQHCLYAEGKAERTRVEVCDKCRGYLKVIASFTPAAPEMLDVEDLATLHLDYIAQERGYARLAVP